MLGQEVVTRRRAKRILTLNRAKSVEDSSTKGEKSQSQQPQPSDHEADRGDKGKGKQQASSDEDYYYLGEQDDFDAFNMQEEEVHEEEELPGVNEQEQEVFDEFEEQAEDAFRSCIQCRV